MTDRSDNNFLLHVKEMWKDSDEEVPEDVRQQIDQLVSSLAAFPRLPMIYFIIDYRTLKYAYISENVKEHTGIDAKTWKEKYTVENIQEFFHPQDKEIIINQLLPGLITLFQLNGDHRFRDMQAQYNYRLRIRGGQWVHVLQQSTVLSFGSNGFPLMDLSVISIVGNASFEARQPIKFSTFVPGEDGVFTEHSTRIFMSQQEGNEPLTDRELEILDPLTQGFTSKEIADRLNISKHTVDTHLRNMRTKINAKNTAELIATTKVLFG